jgi:predicted nuclease of predicted toxin-antitoxin system
LVDACVAGSVARALQDAGFDVESVVEGGRDPGDRLILLRAYEARQILITRDKDFGEIIFRDGAPHSGLLRLAGKMNYAEQSDRTLAALTGHAADPERGCVVTVDADSIRVSPGAPEH